LILAWSLTGEERWKRWLEKVDDYAFRHFADPEHGEWFGYCDQRGNLTHTLKGNNYKGCFHVPRALLLSATRLED
jgi:N-acylglucosamine 2-epimerase